MTNKFLRLIGKIGKLASILWTIAVFAAHVAIIIFGIVHDIQFLVWLAGFSLFYGLVRIGHAIYLLESTKDKDGKDDK